MSANGSPAPLFETDDDRLSFVVKLPRHPLSIVPTVSGEEVTREVTRDVTREVKRLLHALVGEMSRQQIQMALGLKGEEHFRTAYLKPALDTKVVEMTRPDAPRSSKQRYRLTLLGVEWKNKTADPPL
jgi:ATP-dependent DNA helicase RecG